jgi:hypothetical protein
MTRLWVLWFWAVLALCLNSIKSARMWISILWSSTYVLEINECEALGSNNTMAGSEFTGMKP